MGGKRKSKPKKKTKAQKMAVANKAKYGGTAKAAAANKAANKAKAKSYTKTSGAATAAAKNKAAMKAKTKAKFTASQAAKKAAPSKGASISKGTTGIGPVKSGATYSKAVSNATNAPTKKTTGIGPYADGAKYAAALKASPPKFKDGTKVASHDKPLFKSVPATGPAGDTPASDFYKKGMLQKNILPGTPGNPLGIKTAMLGGDYGGSKIGVGLVGAGALTMPSFIRGALDMREGIKKLQEKRLNTDHFL